MELLTNSMEPLETTDGLWEGVKLPEAGRFLSVLTLNIGMGQLPLLHVLRNVFYIAIRYTMGSWGGDPGGGLGSKYCLQSSRNP